MFYLDYLAPSTLKVKGNRIEGTVCRDIDNGASNSKGNDCASPEYAMYAQCNDILNTIDFNAGKQCCRCGGGRRKTKYLGSVAYFVREISSA